MAFNQDKSIAQVFDDFPLTYVEENFVKEKPLAIDSYFRSRFELILGEGIVFNSEYAICEGIIFPILTEIWREYKNNLLIMVKFGNLVNYNTIVLLKIFKSIVFLI